MAALYKINDKLLLGNSMLATYCYVVAIRILQCTCIRII